MKSVLLLLLSLSIFLHSSLSEYTIPDYKDEGFLTKLKEGVSQTYEGIEIIRPSFLHPDVVNNIEPDYRKNIESNYYHAKKEVRKINLFYAKPFRFTLFFQRTFNIIKKERLGFFWKCYLEYSLLISEENHELSKRIFSDSEKVLSKRKTIYYSDEYKRNKDYFIFIKGLHYYLDEDYFNAIVFFEAFFKRYSFNNNICLLSLKTSYNCFHSDILFFLDTLYYLIKSYKIIEDDNYKSGLYIIYAFKSLLLHRIDYKEAYEIWSHKKEIEEMLHEIDFDSIEIEIEKNITEE